MKAILRNYRQSPRKVRLVADLIRGKKIPEAQKTLRFLTKRASRPLAKLLSSAVANARHNRGVADEKDLFIKEIRVDDGSTLKRFMPRAMGRATPIHKRTSHISIVLGAKNVTDAKKADAPGELETAK